MMNQNVEEYKTGGVVKWSTAQSSSATTEK